jgi:hypothetical protein
VAGAEFFAWSCHKLVASCRLPVVAGHFNSRATDNRVRAGVCHRL